MKRKQDTATFCGRDSVVEALINSSMPAASKVMPKLALDATVVRPPFSGVQNAVREQIVAMLSCLQPGEAIVFASDVSLLQHASEAGMVVWDCPPSLANPACRLAWQQLFLPRLLRRFKVSALHAFAYTAPWFCPVPYVLNVHDVIAIDHPEYCSWRNAAHMRMFLPHSVKQAKTNLVSTQHGADRLMQLWQIPSRRIVVAPLGVDARRFAQPDCWSPLLPFPPGTPYWLFVGNLEPKKGVDILLRAFARAASASSPRLVLVGRAAWKCRRLVKDIMTWKHLGQVVWLQHVPNEALPGLYQHATAFVFPSRYEGFGMPVLEAMAAGTPVMHSDHPAVAEVAGNAGVKIKDNDEEHWSDMMRQVAESPAWQQELKIRGQQHAEKFTWQKWAQTAVPVLRQTLP